MKVKQLIKELQKMDQNATIGTLADKSYEFSFTPIAEIIKEDNIELHEDFRGRGKKVFNDWVILIGNHQNWNNYK